MTAASQLPFRLTLLIAIAGVFSFAFWYVFTDSYADKREAPVPAQLATPVVFRSDSPTSERPIEVTPIVRNDKKRSPMAILDGGSPARDSYPELLRLANAGDIEAMAALQWLSIHCSPYRSRFGPRDHPRQSLVNLPLESPERVVREQALQLSSAYCDGTFAPGELKETSGRFLERLESAAREGDPAARAYRFFEGEDEAATLDAYLETENPWIAESALMAFATHKGPLAREIDAAVFPSLMRSVSPQEVDTIKMQAARWRGCQLGRPCGANQIYELNRCVAEGECTPGRSIYLIIQQRELSGRQFELMQRYLAALDAEFKRGG